MFVFLSLRSLGYLLHERGFDRKRPISLLCRCLSVFDRILEENVGRLLNYIPLPITGQRYARPSLDPLRLSMDSRLQ